MGPSVFVVIVCLLWVCCKAANTNDISIEPSTHFDINNTDDFLIFVKEVKSTLQTYSSSGWSVNLFVDIETNSSFSSYLPIGGTKKFRGKFNGNGHTITVKDCRVPPGLFWELEEAAISSLVINGTFGGFVVGALAVKVSRSVNLFNITSNAKIEPNEIGGGLIGSIDGGIDMKIDSCSFSGSFYFSVSSQEFLYAGGFIGLVNGSSTHISIMKSVNDAGVIGPEGINSTAGFIGRVACGTILHAGYGKDTIVDHGFVDRSDGTQLRMGNVLKFEDCINRKPLKCRDCNASGFVGFFSSSSTNISFDNCVNLGGIENDANAGGFIGVVECQDGNCYTFINNSRNSGKIMGRTAGGFVGLADNQIVVVFYVALNNGNVTGKGTNSFAGGFVGHLNRVVRVMNSENNGTVDGQHSCGFVCGETRSQLLFESCVNHGSVSGVMTAYGIASGSVSLSAVANLGRCSGKDSYCCSETDNNNCLTTKNVCKCENVSCLTNTDGVWYIGKERVSDKLNGDRSGSNCLIWMDTLHAFRMISFLFGEDILWIPPTKDFNSFVGPFVSWPLDEYPLFDCSTQGILTSYAKCSLMRPVRCISSNIVITRGYYVVITSLNSQSRPFVESVLPGTALEKVSVLLNYFHNAMFTVKDSNGVILKGNETVNDNMRVYIETNQQAHDQEDVEETSIYELTVDTPEQLGMTIEEFELYLIALIGVPGVINFTMTQGENEVIVHVLIDGDYGDSFSELIAYCSSLANATASFVP